MAPRCVRYYCDAPVGRVGMRCAACADTEPDSGDEGVAESKTGEQHAERVLRAAQVLG